MNTAGQPVPVCPGQIHSMHDDVSVASSPNSDIDALRFGTGVNMHIYWEASQ